MHLVRRGHGYRQLIECSCTPQPERKLAVYPHVLASQRRFESITRLARTAFEVAAKPRQLRAPCRNHRDALGLMRFHRQRMGFIQQRIRTLISAPGLYPAHHGERRQSMRNGQSRTAQQILRIFHGLGPGSLFEARARAECAHVEAPRIELVLVAVGDACFAVRVGGNVVPMSECAREHVRVRATHVLLEATAERDLEAQLRTRASPHHPPRPFVPCPRCSARAPESHRYPVAARA